MQRTGLSKIKFAVIVALLVSFTVFFLSLYFYTYGLDNQSFLGNERRIITEKEFFSQKFNNNTIFIIGSSQIGPLNATQIENFLNKNDHKFDVYNLSILGDVPKKRINSLNNLISAKPDVIIYGISDRDFTYTSKDNLETILPEPKKIFKETFENFSESLDIDLKFLSSPLKITSLVLMEYLQKSENSENSFFYMSNTPFVPFSKKDMTINENISFKKTGYGSIEISSENENINDFEKMIETFKENDIKVIVFSIPQSNYYLKNMPIELERSFYTVVNSLEIKNGVEIYDLYKKYADLNVWSDMSHVSMHPNVTMYSNDVAEIILMEIEE